MKFRLRDINSKNTQEVDLVVRRTMDTVLETIPEFEGNEEIARRAFKNFTFSKMREMISVDFAKTTHGALVAINEKNNEVIGHALFSIKEDKAGEKFGFCYSRFVSPEARRKGVASALLEAQERWWRSLGAKYIFAQTHVTNNKLQTLFEKNGFTKSDVKKGEFYSFYELRKNL